MCMMSAYYIHTCAHAREILSVTWSLEVPPSGISGDGTEVESGTYRRLAQLAFEEPWRK